ncbi:DUF6226 family protein [Vallicoccus soli]|uniref:Uncharacterized protein n=1 Tax=Vallicoccus soli TaxID=2339232 RepID=A0A3A3Z6R6_9ACTN|nr:DUF6226 family protein [Vallicoccus soli]RJK96405.1 hypothetical protein D5H78_09250 [Vallicoccus soli]
MSRWGPEGPPDEAYERVTDPERFGVLHGVARALVADLERRFAVRTEQVAGGVRLVPDGGGTPLEVELTPFPGVRLRYGRSGGGAFPLCGCDACDEDPQEVAEQLREAVEDVVGGRYAEELACEPGKATVTTRTPGSTGCSSYDEEEAEPYGPPGLRWQHAWPAWPARGS